MNSMSSIRHSLSSSIAKTDVGISTPGPMMAFQREAQRFVQQSFLFQSKGGRSRGSDPPERGKCCGRISAFIGASVGLGAAISALTRDISTEFAQGKTYNSLDKEDFNAGMTGVFQTSGHIWRITKHIPWFGPTMKPIPIDWVMKSADEGTNAFFRYLKECTQDTQELLDIATSSSHDDKALPQRTIVHEILDSHLPSSEKTFPRVFDEVATVTAAGFETTASVLRLIFFHVFSNLNIVQQLRAEVTSAAAETSGPVELRTLEQLPYLTSVIMEGLRLSPAIASRMARISDKDLFYGDWCIPAGTLVGMTTILMHTNDTLYPDPLRFDPDRWMDTEARKKTKKTYAPFSRGTRICLGMQYVCSSLFHVSLSGPGLSSFSLAWAEMYLAFAGLVQRFDFKFEGITAAGFEMESDQFIIGTRGKSVLKAQVTSHMG
ncbi:MAG: hypothetical protein Q9160_001969 [Pyrenula sp. 1 TL-2023]